MFQLGAIRTGWIIFFLRFRERIENQSIRRGSRNVCGNCGHTLLTSSLSLLAYTTASSSLRMELRRSEYAEEQEKHYWVEEEKLNRH